MNNLWKKEYILRGSDFDKFNHLKPSAILDLFQDAAGQHAEELGVGFEDMFKQNYLWVLTKIKFQVFSTPKSYENIIVRTWPLKPKRINYCREYSIETLRGDKLIAGSSEWAVIHSEKRRIVSVPDLYQFNDNYHQEVMFNEKFTKVPDFTLVDTPYKLIPTFNDLDLNNHVNNTKYANFVMDAINPQETDEVEFMQIDYRKEVTQDTCLNIYYQKENDTVLAKGQNNNSDTMFACKIKLKSRSN